MLVQIQGKKIKKKKGIVVCCHVIHEIIEWQPQDSNRSQVLSATLEESGGQMQC